MIGFLKKGPSMLTVIVLIGFAVVIFQLEALRILLRELIHQNSN